MFSLATTHNVGVIMTSLCVIGVAASMSKWSAWAMQTNILDSAAQLTTPHALGQTLPGRLSILS